MHAGSGGQATAPVVQMRSDEGCKRKRAPVPALCMVVAVVAEGTGSGVRDPCLPLWPTALLQESVLTHLPHLSPTTLSSWGLPSFSSMPLTDGGRLRAWESAEGHTEVTGAEVF